MNAQFLIDVMNGNTTFAGVALAWSKQEVVFSPHFHATSFTDTMIELTKAIVFGQEITLYDADLSVSELELIGVTPDKIRCRTQLEPFGDGSVEVLSQRILAALSEQACRVTLFTSGTTGRPKRVTHQLRTLARSVRADQRHTNDVWAFAYNPTHIAGVQVFLQALFNLNPLVDVFKLTPAEVRARCLEHGVTHISATPTFYRLLLEDSPPILTVRSVTLGGERSDDRLLEGLRSLFPNARIRNIYASTEAGALLVSNGEYFQILPELHDLVRIREGGIEVHRSLTGEMEGNNSSGVEWFETGDLVDPDPENSQRFKIIGRANEWINVGGSKVNPGEVEAALLSHPAVAMARVFGWKNSVTGEIVYAEVVLRSPGFDEQKILRHLAGRLQGFKVPRLLIPVREIARTRTGKIQRNA